MGISTSYDNCFFSYPPSIIPWYNPQEEEKQRDLAQWLTDRRDGRAENRRLAEELRMAKMFEEIEEKKRLEAQRAAEEKKAEEEAAAKKAKKKGKGKK